MGWLGACKSRFRFWIEQRVFKLGPKSYRKQFSIEHAFPPTDPLAIDILRLLAAYNDFSSVDEWLMQDLSYENHALSVVSRANFTVSKIDLQLRLLGSILHEAIQTLEEFVAAPSSETVLDQLDATGKDTLQSLLAIAKGADVFSRKVLAVTRHKLSYHYDKTVFHQGLRALLLSPECNKVSNVLLLQHEAPRRYFYFRLADDLRREAIKRQGRDGQSYPELKVVFETHDLFRALLRQLLTIYSKQRNLDFGLDSQEPCTVQTA
jgi:hypothetical protein